MYKTSYHSILTNIHRADVNVVKVQQEIIDYINKNLDTCNIVALYPKGKPFPNMEVIKNPFRMQIDIYRGKTRFYYGMNFVEMKYGKKQLKKIVVGILNNKNIHTKYNTFEKENWWY